MQYQLLKSIVASRKIVTTPPADSESFSVQHTRVHPYIEPRFSKTDFPKEKPAILLVSAIGASGKTTTARALSFDVQLPILDLAKHNAVGANTLTGILTTAYPIEAVGGVLEGLQKGTHCVIIDGIDEGRSKTTEQGFDAFLDDLVQRSEGATATAIVVFGRSQVLFNTWIYLCDNAADVGFVQLEPFDIEQARNYVDTLVVTAPIAQHETYKQARDGVLNKLGAAFSPVSSDDITNRDVFLSFIGYPPVLDAIATLLQTERNYYRIQQAIGDGSDEQLETNLLIRICDYLLRREHEEKALPNFIEPLADTVRGSLGRHLRATLYDRDEQCARVLSLALNRPFPLQLIEDAALNDQYENAAGDWCGDHPLLSEGKVRNAVFAAFAVARCVLSGIGEYRDLAFDYATSHSPTYHLLHLLHVLGKGRTIDAQHFNMLIQSCLEFLGANAEVSIEIDGTSWEERDAQQDAELELSIEIGFPEQDQRRAFTFQGLIGSEVIPLGPYLVNTNVTVPCAVHLLGSTALQTMGVCNISARRVQVNTPELVVRDISGMDQDAGLFINTHEVEGHADVTSVITGTLDLRCVEHKLTYPLVKYISKGVAPFRDSALSEKHRRLRRIFSEFASHKRGRLAKFRRKIEHERVLRGELGRRMLNALMDQGVLSRDTRFYYADRDMFAEKLGISWQELRQYKINRTLEEFLKSVPARP